MHETIAALRQLALFEGLPDDAVARLAGAACLRRCTSGELVVLEGEPCRAVYGVVAGRVRVSRSAASGREQVLTELGRGEMINAVPVFELQAVNHATVRTLTATTLVLVDSSRFLECVRISPELALALLRSFAGRIARLVGLVEDLSLRTVRGRLARFLLTHEGAQEPAGRWTQEEVAAHLGTVRDVVGRSLRAFADEGMVRMERQRIVLLDRARLESEAGQ